LKRALAAALSRAALPALQCLDPELAHDLGLAGLGAMHGLWTAPAIPAGLACRTLGLGFAHPVGLAAGFDKNGDHLDALGALGFSHVELGTVTPRPQPGNPKPRMFRLREATAIVNRMGFNNKGVDHLVARLQASRYAGVRGISIGKNVDTPIERAEDDYVLCLRRVYPHAGYVAVNISSPNTARLRELQDPDGLQRILGALVTVRRELAAASGRQVPLLVKVAPNLDATQVADIAALLTGFGIDGVIATNTSNDLHAFADRLPPGQQGGLSGAPVHALSLAVIRQLRAALGRDFPIIGVGGITTAAAAQQTLAAGATLLQVWTGFALRGPALLDEILAALAASSR